MDTDVAIRTIRRCAKWILIKRINIYYGHGEIGASWNLQIRGIKMEKLKISFLQKSNMSEASRVLSEAMLKNPLHIAVFQGHSEKERQTIENEKLLKS